MASLPSLLVLIKLKDMGDRSETSDRQNQQASDRGRGKMPTNPSNIPSLPGNDTEAWKKARDFFEHFQFTLRLGKHGWASLDDVEKAVTVSTFEHLQKTCRKVMQPWTGLLSTIIDATVDLHKNFSSPNSSVPRLESPLWDSQSRSPPWKPQNTRKSLPVAGSSRPSDRSLPQMKPLLPPNSERPPPMASFTEWQQQLTSQSRQSSLDFSGMQLSSASQSRQSSLGFTSMQQLSTSSHPKTSSANAGSPHADDMTIDGDDVREALPLGKVQESEYSSLWEKLVSPREIDPANYFGDSNPIATAFSPATRTLPRRALPTRLLEVLDALEIVPITTLEQMAIEQAMLNAHYKVPKADHDRLKAARTFLERAEIRRAIFSSRWWREQMKIDYQSILNAWGVGAEHEDTCVMISEKFVAWLPEDLVREMQRDEDLFNHHYMPVPLFKDGSDNRKPDFRLRSELRVTKSRTSMIFTRFLAWCQWCDEESPTKADQEAELRFLIRSSLQASHRCGHGHCIIHTTFEPKYLNAERDICQAVARRLRKEGEPVPKFCSLHSHKPCLLRLQAQTTAETFNTQASIALGQRNHWVKELEEHLGFQNRENFYPPEFASSSQLAGQLVEQNSADDDLIDEFSNIKLYNGPIPPGFKKRIQCPLCLASYSAYNVEFYRHARDEHTGDPGFLYALKAHRKAWKQTYRNGTRKLPYPELDRLLLELRIPITAQEAVDVIEEALQICPLCPAPQVRPYHTSTWVHLNTHFEHERYLEVVLHRGTKWKADVKREHPVSKAFLDSLLVDGATKEEIRDLIAEFGAKKRRKKDKAVSTAARGSRKRKAAVLGLDEDRDDKMGEEFVAKDDSEGLSDEEYSNFGEED